MKLATLGLATALAFTSSYALAQSGAGMSNSAGSAAAGANSGRNPSGNTLINPSPSGSTLTPAPGGR